MFKRNCLLFSMAIILVLNLLPTLRANAETLHGGYRIEGVDRYETCISVSKKGWPVSSDYAVLTTGEDFPDAVSIAPWAAANGIPILLTGANTISQGV